MVNFRRKNSIMRLKKGYKFNHIAEMNTITIANKLDLSDDFYNRHNMHAVERKLNALKNRNNGLFNKSNRNWRHLFSRKFESFRA